MVKAKQQKVLKALARLLSYPDERTIDVAELLYVILQDELPDAAKDIADFGAFLERADVSEAEEAFTRTFDINPACALEVGWHLFGEEYARGMFLVRMREELRKYGIPETSELPDHVTHVLTVVAAMPADEAARFVRACVFPAVEKMRQALIGKETPFARPVNCLARVLKQIWGGDDGKSICDEEPHRQALPDGVDLLHAFPVADVAPGCGSACGHSEARIEFVPLSIDTPYGR